MITLNWIAVESKLISAVAHEGTTFYIRFPRGTEYAYDNVPENVIEEFFRSESKGSFFMRHIKGLYPYRKLPCPSTSQST